MGLFSSKKKERKVAIFDIGSGSVGGALALIPVDGKSIPTILKSFRTEIAERDELDFDTFLKDMLVALNSTIEKLYQEKLGAFDEIVCVMTSPWYLSETRVVKMEKDHSFVFDQRLADDLFRKEAAALIGTYQMQYGAANSVPEIIENNIINVSLNGYSVNNPYGKRSRFIEMDMIISISPKICLEKIRETISHTFHHVPVSFSSFIVTSYLAVREKYISPDSYLLLDISGEITDVGVVTKGILKHSLSFPFGRQTLFKSIAKKMKIEKREAEEIFKLYSTDKITEELKNKLEPILEAVKKSWNEFFTQSLSVLPRTLTLPSTVFLTVNTDIKKWFTDVISNEELIKSSSVERDCTVVTIDGPEFLEKCSYKNGVCDPFIMIEAIGIMRKIENKYE